MNVAKHIRKFRYDPTAYLADSRHWLLHHVALHVLTPVIDRPAVREWMFDPETAAMDIQRPAWLRRAVERVVERGRRERRARLAAAENPRVAVIMPVHNASATLDQAARSVLDQTYANIELILVDDGSQDDSLLKMRELAFTDPRVRVVAGAGNHGAGVARNRGMACCTAPFLAFQDADDVSHPERLERQLHVLIDRPDLVAVYCYGRRVDREGRGVRVNGQLNRRFPPTALLRREVVMAEVGYFRRMRIAEDTEYMKRIARAFSSARIATLNKVLYLALYSPRSTQFSDGEVTYDRGEVHHTASIGVRNALSEMERAHAAMASSGSFFVPFEDP